jgi:hypothetical protein
VAQHDYSIANQSGAAFRADLNNALAAIVSQNSGAAEPSTTFAYQPWADTTNGLFKIRNAANSAWITLYQLDGEWGAIPLENGSATSPPLYFKNSGTDTGIFSPGADQFGITTAGVERVEYGASEVVFNDGGVDYDFRVEGDTKANLFLIDASADAVSFDGNVTISNQNGLRFGDSDNSNWVALQAPATVSSNVTWALPAADGTAGQSLVTDGSGALSFAARSRLIAGTAVASTSGTSIDFTSIPSWVRRITVILYGVSTNGVTGVQIQLGDSGGVETTGYTSTGTAITGTNTCFVASYTSGFVMLGSSNLASRSGLLTIANIDGNVWIASGTFDDGATQAGHTQGFKVLSGTLDRVRITTVSGTDTFDAGAVNIIYEG